MAPDVKLIGHFAGPVISEEPLKISQFLANKAMKEWKYYFLHYDIQQSKSNT